MDTALVAEERINILHCLLIAVVKAQGDDDNYALK